MSLNIPLLKFISILSFLLINGVQENGVPNFAILLIYLFQFFSDVFSNTAAIFWEGLITIPIFGLLILFLRSKNYKDLLSCFLSLLVVLVYITGVLNNYHRIGLTFIIPLLIFLISSIYVILLVKKRAIQV
jgi:hypothetical protein